MAEFCRQRVPDSLGKAIFCGAVALEVRVTGVVCPPKICKLPLFATVNLVAPDALAVKILPLGLDLHTEDI